MIRLICIFILLGLATGCNLPGKNPINIDAFSEFPPEIDGCSCTFSKTEADYKKDVFIYADDYQETAFVVINGVMTKFKLVGERSNTSSAWTNEEYDLLLETQKIGESDEVTQLEGTLTLSSKDGWKLVKTIYGECGC